MKIKIIGAGAAGCFCAVELKKRIPQADIEVLETQARPLAKVAITGGGRCNLTNSFNAIEKLTDAYPRGAQLMKRVFSVFDHRDTWHWWENAGVALTLQDDECVFPVSQDAMEIVNTLTRLMRTLGVRLSCNTKVSNIQELDADIIVVTTGGGALSLLEGSGIVIEKPVPSLFTFRIDDESLKSLMGTVVEDAQVSLAGTKFKAHGPLLITDWGVSGPAILKLSSYAARHLADNQYQGELSICWMEDFEPQSGQKMVAASHPEALTDRLWRHIVKRSGIREDIRWAELGSKGLNKLRETVSHDCYHISGKCRFKDEFVTCGGVSLSDINLNTLECKKHPGLYFAGEVLDVDAITGGFNLQAAWSMAYVVAKSIAESQQDKL